MIGRIAITDVRPQVSCGRWPARAVVGEALTVSATVFREGHDAISADVLLRRPGERAMTDRHPMAALGNDRWSVDVPVDTGGEWTFTLEAYADPIATWRHAVAVKHAVAQPVEVELEEGARLHERLLEAFPAGAAADRRQVADVVAALRRTADDDATRLGPALSAGIADITARHPLRELVTSSEDYAVWVDRPRALYGAWYEFFPRSEGARGTKSGTFRTAERRLPAIAEMGFDVVYLPPIHPIGHTHRKGPNNTLVAEPADPGSPWAIGSEDGGHDAVHPDLGDLTDFDAFVARTRELGMEVALDFALQCSPDHPWAKEHPEWFTIRADGSIAYAENPPKKYQDIYPLNFDTDPEGLYTAILGVLRHWMDHGVRIFRVDNPHTKPLPFWERLIAEVKATDPDVLFLSEAFTRPAMMRMLARIGFHQSYTYYTWRNAKGELEDYLRELAHSDVADYMRPNFFVNTQDILHAYLQRGGPPAFKVRSVLAAMLSPTWGVYSGFELCEREPLREGSEEYLDSEKYQYRPRDWSQPSLAPYLATLNRIRRSHPALQWLRNLRFHRADNDAVTAFSKRHGDDVVLVVVNLDPLAAHESTVRLDMPELGLDWTDDFLVCDALTGAEYRWRGASNYVRLDPLVEPAHVFTVRRGLTVSIVQEGAERDPRWYQRAVFYEVLIRGFYDCNGDGTGDIAGLTEKLDYLQWLGVDCIWLLPIYQSPMRDGGYDISDFFTVLPEFGAIGDFVKLVDAAHARGIRIIADLVVNHTSDAHPWFQASRSDPTGPYGDFYVWSDTKLRYQDARVIFVDSETSNWTWDPGRGQYYWHRFFSHQPDLNFANPAVQDTMIEVLRYWLDLGIDGLRLDAVPYLFEADGTNCENLSDTHAFLKRLRKEVDASFTDRVLLAEANQWPSDVVEYFGDDDECHMAFHFPLMPRIFMAVRREQRYPISEILAQTPAIPQGCQWGIFLRNHDELTLEMVTDEERDYMYAEYATDPRMKANVGIRRRLAPLLENSRDQIELFTGLLFSLPGSPVLYYGDEIGMGDNIYLGDRDGVRTPMQWTSDRNGGFSRADFARLYLPPLLDPVYGYQSINVEAQLRQPTSLLWWTRRMLQVRKEHPVFGVGSYEELGASNPSVLAFVRAFGDDVVLCVNNLSRFAQPVELDLRRFEGYTPVELLGGVPFPRIGELPYLLTIAHHGFYWFQLTHAEDDR